MKTPERFTNAVTKLYIAFHNGELESMICQKCAVGNIVGGREWSGYLKGYGSIEENNLGRLLVDKSGYSSEELLNIERIFMRKSVAEIETKETQFDGLCSVVEYLCELDGIPNVMDYTCLFETEEEKPKYSLCEIF